MKYTKCQRCHHMRSDYARGGKSCDRCLEQLSQYQKDNLSKTKERRTIKAREYRNTEKGNEVAKLTQRRMTLLYPEKYRARYAVLQAKRTGALAPQPCSNCGVDKVEAHHSDYSRPLDVMWLCKTHHVEVHYA